MGSDKTKASHILKKWAADLASKDRSRASLNTNFDELFYELWRASIPFSIAEDTLPDAVKEHLPSSYVANTTYKYAKAAKRHGDQSFNEYLNSWKDLIKREATSAFYDRYPIDGVEEKEEKKFGNMSTQEYSKQRKYADSFPLLDIEELKRKREELMRKETEGDDGET